MATSKNVSIADNESFADTADEETASLLRVANYNINQSIIFYEAALRMTEPMTKEEIERLKAKDIPTNAPDNSTPDKIRDSLARGMEQCLLKMQEHFAEHNLTAAHKEWKLYQICSQALHDVKEVMTA